MPERKLIDIDQAHRVVAPNGAVYSISVDNAGTFSTTLVSSGVGASAQALWKVSEYSGSGALLDLSGNGHDMAFPGGANDPKYLAYSASKYLYLPGISGNYATVPDATNLRFTGDLDIRVDVALDDWTPSTRQQLVSKYGAASNRGYALEIGTDGKIATSTSSNGTADAGSGVSSVATGLTDGERKTIRWTLDADNGSGGRDSRFYLGDSVNGPWTQLGTTVTIGSTISIHPSTATLAVGAMPFGGFGTEMAISGKVYRVMMRDVVNDQTVLDIDFSDANPANTTFLAETGQTVTINRSSTGRKSVVVDRDLMLFGTDDYLSTPTHANLNFAAAESFTAVIVYRGYNLAGRGHPTPLLTKKTASFGGDAGWAVWGSAAGDNMGIGDGAIGVEAFGPTGTDGVIRVTAARRNVSADNLQAFSNGTGGTAVTDTTTASLSTGNPVRIARDALGGAAEIELIGAAIFRSALTDEQIALLAGEFGV